MKFLTKEIKIALVAVCGLVILFFGMNFQRTESVFISQQILYLVQEYQRTIFFKSDLCRRI